jgi:hypothetical protein
MVMRIAPHLAYHGEIGREATATLSNSLCFIEAYHGEIGREATAVVGRHDVSPVAYHGEIGREATAHPITRDGGAAAYHGEIGREPHPEIPPTTLSRPVRRLSRRSCNMD